MSEAKTDDQRSQSSNASPTSTQRVARWRERRRRGVLYLCSLETFDRDFRLLKAAGYLASDDPKVVTRAEFENALGLLLDGLAKRFGVFRRADTPGKSAV
jgi:hypothetical protein